MGVMVGFLIGTLQWGLVGTLGAFVGVGLLLLILVGIVYLLSRLPTFRWLTLQLSFLEWRRRKTRAASLLLAMSIGVLGIGLILMLADTVLAGLTDAVEDVVGGDVPHHDGYQTPGNVGRFIHQSQTTTSRRN
ncbi:MAG: hypothetical protein IH805_01590 [Proteobacteria bacterium]|nr:hypothetical protein [Pseudomonadota bacterium]